MKSPSSSELHQLIEGSSTALARDLLARIDVDTDWQESTVESCASVIYGYTYQGVITVLGTVSETLQEMLEDLRQ